MPTTAPHRLILREYCNFARRRDRHQPERGATASDGMAYRARELWATELPMSEVIHRLLGGGGGAARSAEARAR